MFFSHAENDREGQISVLKAKEDRLRMFMMHIFTKHQVVHLGITEVHRRSSKKSAERTLLKVSLQVMWPEVILSSPYWSTQRWPPNRLCTQVVTLLQRQQSNPSPGLISFTCTNPSTNTQLRYLHELGLTNKLNKS